MTQRVLDQRWPWVLGGIVVVLMFLSAFIEIDPEAARPPREVGTVDDIARRKDREDLNVLFILIDTLRGDRLGSYGYERDTTPELDALAATGIRFDRHLAQSSWTKASMASMWTGLYPLANGVVKFDDIVSDQARMPAETLKAAGFRTVAIYRNGWVSPNFGFDQGFDVYTRPAPTRIPPSVRRENPTIAQLGTDEDVVRSAQEFLRVHGHERWFLYLHLMDVHEYLYDEDTALFGGSYSDVYDNSIRWTDRALGHLFRTLDAEGFSRNTVVVVISDHGEAFRERGYEGHARLVYKESTEVPFLIRLPFELEPGIVVPGRTRNVDVWPTLYDMLGFETPPGLDGRSRPPDILAAGRGKPAPEGEPRAVAHLDQRWGQGEPDPLPAVAVAEGPLRYVRSASLVGGPPIEELFDTRVDARELQDVSKTDPETFARLRAEADRYLDTSPSWGEAPTRELDEMELNQLRALGYALP